MINPQPVDRPSSPYSPNTDQGRPSQPPSVLPPVTPPEEPKKKRRISWRRTLAIFSVALLGSTFAYGFHHYRALTKNVLVENDGEAAAILQYDPNDRRALLDHAKFTRPGDGRFTMVLAGMGGGNHPGAQLTDSIQVLSIDTINDQMSFTSLPRDLFVDVSNHGRMKLNAVYSAAERKKKGSGPVVLKETVSNILNTRVSNFALIDFAGTEHIVDALGGIEIDVPKAINDPFYPADDMLNYAPFSVKAGPQTMNGKTALKYMRSRKTTSDFDRSERQQLVFAAVKDKAISAGVITNPSRVSALLNAISRNFKTDLTTDEVRVLINEYRSISPENTSGFVLDTSSALGLLTSTSDPVAGYIAYPILGYDRFEAVQQWFHKNNPDPLLARETPSITLYGTGKATDRQLSAYAEFLRDYGFQVTISQEKLNSTTYNTTRAVSRNPAAKPFSRNYLGSLVRQSVERGSFAANVTTDFEVVYVPTATAANARPTTAPTRRPAPVTTPLTTPAPETEADLDPDPEPTQ
jgi:LCP family protein required for cell wall assembly